MAKDQEPMSATLRAVLAVVLFGITVAGISWTASGNNSAQAGVVNLNSRRITTTESRITTTEKGLVVVKEDLVEFKEETVERFTTNEKSQIRVEFNQAALLKGQEAIRQQRKEDAKLSREQRKEDTRAIQSVSDAVVGLKAYLESIESITNQ